MKSDEGMKYPRVQRISQREFIQHPRRGDHRILISADDSYLSNYAFPLIATAILNCVPIHVNALEPSLSTLNTLRALSTRFVNMISISNEWGLPPDEERIAYCAASRFFCAWELVERWDMSLLIVDTDSLLLRPIRFPSADYGLYIREISDDRFRIAAGAVYLRKGGLSFIQRFIDLYLARRPWAWFDDQICLAQAHDLVQSTGTSVVRISNRLLSFDYHPDVAIWSPKGDNKIYDPLYVAVTSALRSLIDRNFESSV